MRGVPYFGDRPRFVDTDEPGSFLFGECSRAQLWAVPIVLGLAAYGVARCRPVGADL